jgi:hypothetical protein
MIFSDESAGTDFGKHDAFGFKSIKHFWQR